MKKLEFGYKCKDVVTGYEGILKTRATFITGCDRVELVAADKEDGRWFDVPVVTIVDNGVFEALQETKQCNVFDDINEALYNFGTLVKDKITDFTGKIVGKSMGISGDISYCVSPKYDKSAKENNGHWIDEGRIEVISLEKEEIKINEKRTGGAVPSLKYR